MAYLPAPASSAVVALRRARALNSLGTSLIRLGLAFLLALFGTFKLFRFEAEAIRPMVSQSPLLAWMYLLFSVRTAAALLGTVELAAALGLLLGPRWPSLGAVGGALASLRFLITLTFVVTTQELLVPGSLVTGFFLKDLVLLGAALECSAGFLLARRARPTPVPEPIPLRVVS